MKYDHYGIQKDVPCKITDPLVWNILNVILDFSHYDCFSDGDYIEENFVVHLEKIFNAVRENRRIHCILPAFPAKSPNRKKTLSHLPDMGEYLGLTRLNQLAEKISDIYEPGARITICSDGRVFGDLVRVSDEQVSEYSFGIKNMINKHQLVHLDIYTLEDYFGYSDFSKMRSSMTSSYGKSTDDIRREVLSDPNERMLFNGIHRFMFEDLKEVIQGISANQLRKIARDVSYRVIQRSHAWSHLITKKFPEGVRLTIHPYHISAGKIGMELVPGESRWSTPWHNVVLKNGDQYSLTHRSNAEAINAIKILDRPGYFCYQIF